MANEFIIKNGFISQGNSIVNAILSANTIQILTAPTLNNSNTQILSRNSSTGAIEYSVISGVTSDNYVTGGTYSNGTLTLNRQNGSVTVTGLTSNDTYITGFTYNDNNRLTISQNQGQPDLTLYLNTFSGLTVNGDLNVTGLTQTNGITSTGGVIFPKKTIISNYTATTEDYFINISGGTFDVTLPSAVPNTGRIYIVKNEGPGIINVLAQSGETIDDRTYVILTESNSLHLISDGINWVIIGYNISSTQSNTGVIEFSGLSKTSATQFSVGPIKGFIVDDTTNPVIPFLTYIEYSGGTFTDNYVTTDFETFVYITSGGVISQQPTPLTEQQRRQNIFLGKLGHPDKVAINLVFSQPDFVLSPLSQLRDVFVPINLINGGVLPSTNGTNLKFNTSAGYIYGLGINFTLDALNPNSLYVPATSPCTFQYRTQTGGTVTNVTDIDPLNYDVGGVITPITGTKASNQRIYLLQNGTIRIQYGQHLYNTLALAIESLQTESFTPFPNFINNAVLIGVLTVLSTATDLTDSSKARFFFASKFGETVGAAGGVSTTNLQQAYNNSSNPEIITNSILDGFQIRGGTGSDNDKNIIIESNAGVQTAWITASGDSKFNSVSATTINTNLVDFNTNYTGGTTQGRISWDSGTGTLNIGVGDPGGTLIDFQVGQEEVVRVYNSELTTLNKGELVYVSGSQGNRPSVKRAIATSDGYSVTTLGMVTENISSGAEGYVTTFGIINSLNTLGLTGGTPIFLSPTVAGAYTSTKPQAPQHIVLIGYVVRVSATVGSVFINISNGWELDEIHDVRISGATTGDLLMRSTYNGSNVWVNTKNLIGDYTINGELTVTGATNVSYIDFDTTLSGTTSAEGRLFWDVNNRTLSLGMIGGPVQQIGEEQYYLVEAASTILDGRVVGAVGTTGVGGKILADYIIADGSIPAITTLGILTQTLSAGTVGYVTSFGLVRDLDTTGTPYGEVWSNGDILYISPTIPGGLTKNKPLAPNLDVVIALVIYTDSTNGSIFVRPSIGFGLDQINGVSITGATNYDILQYNSTNSLWENTNSPILNTLTINSGITINNDLVINYVPQTNNSINDFLVRESNGDVSLRTFNSINYTPNLITVSLSGGSSDFTSIKLAVDSITAATSNNPYTVKVGPGVYYENNPINLPSWVALVGDDSISTIIEAVDPSQTLFYLGDQSAIFDCQIQGVTGTGVSAIVYSSSTTPQSAAISYVENVRFGTNYTHAKVIGSGSANIIMQCSNVKYGGYPFTIGFEATNDGSPSAIGRMQLRNVTSTNGGVTSTTGLTFAKADKPNCGFIVNGCLLTKAQGSPAGTGFYVENGAFLRLTGVNFQRWLTGIHAPQIGSAPSIDAIALNFENCTTDVNISHSGTTGKIQGTDTFLKTNININAPLYEVNQDPRVITVAKKGGDFNSIKSAVNYLILSANTSSDNRYAIQVGPGVFLEDEIDLTQTPYVSIVGSNIQTTQILPTGSTHNIIKIGQNNEISFLSLGNAGPNQAAVYAYDIGDFGQLHKISIYDCDIGIWVESVTQDTKLYAEYVDMNGEFTYGTKCVGNGYLALANLENYYLFPTSTGNTIGNHVIGSGATINMTSSSLEGIGVTGSTAILSEDGGNINVAATDVFGWGYGLRLLNSGLPSSFEINATTFLDNVLDISVEQTSATGVFQGISSHEKVTTVSNDIYWSFLDADDGEFDITRKASVTFTDGSHTDFTTLIFEGGSMGLLDGGILTKISGTTILADGGFGYVEKSDNSGIVRRIDWSNNNLTLPTNSNNYIYIDENTNLLYSGFRPNSFYNIILGRVVTNSTEVEFIDLSPFNAEHTSNRFGSLFREALGPIYAFGSIVTEGTTPLTLDVTAGEYYFSTNEYVPAGGTGITFTQYYEGTGSTWVTTATTIVNNTQYNNNGTLTGLTSGYYTKHTLYVVGDGVYENYFLVLGQNQYSTLVEAENGLLPTPPSYFSDSVVQIANIYVQQGFSGITQVEDIRPTIAFRAGGVNASSVHGNLLGLTSDDHPQYLLVDGTRAMVGNLDMGTNNIVSAGTINNVTIQSHATRHQFNGSDPVGSSTPSANAIPYADSNGLLDSWVSTASTTTFGLVKTSTSSSTVISNNDTGYLNSITGLTFGNNVLTGFTVNGGVITTTINATGGLTTKANTVAGASFTGNPKKYNVVFTTAYPNTNYSIQITGAVNRSFTYESKATTGFTINTNANTTFTENVDWVTIGYGES